MKDKKQRKKIANEKRNIWKRKRNNRKIPNEENKKEKL